MSETGFSLRSLRSLQFKTLTFLGKTKTLTAEDVKKRRRGRKELKPEHR
jgi:hypothetical protein